MTYAEYLAALAALDAQKKALVATWQAECAVRAANKPKRPPGRPRTATSETARVWCESMTRLNIAAVDLHAEYARSGGHDFSDFAVLPPGFTYDGRYLRRTASQTDGPDVQQ